MEKKEERKKGVNEKVREKKIEESAFSNSHHLNTYTLFLFLEFVPGSSRSTTAFEIHILKVRAATFHFGPLTLKTRIAILPCTVLNGIKRDLQAVLDTSIWKIHIVELPSQC